MGIKKVAMLAVFLTAVVSGGEVSAMAKTKQISKFTHVKVSKRTVSGKTTKYAHVKLTHLKHGEKVGTKADKHGKFVIKVKQNNLTKLKFKLKATKHGFKGQTYTHTVKVTKPVTNNAAVTEQNTVKPENVVKPSTPVSNFTTSGNNQLVINRPSRPVRPSRPRPTAPTTPSKSKEQLIREKKAQLEIAKNAYAKIVVETEPAFAELSLEDYDEEFLVGYQLDIERARLEVQRKLATGNKDEIATAQKNLELAKEKYEKYLPLYLAVDKKFYALREKIRPFANEVNKLARELHILQPDAPYEGINHY
ncbi:carboxypeptidase-like regulatory domain-containing protein [Levilactobacillus andaensis]|uniref:carboxypeptidase-like regulatory domain-containing protein n=1 Tax=Levilactobacillus andaensis TaxID=2799570 RepID=UPI0019415E0A|nr:carboxypeptidase-like regulatory domain-containing protein [Levilactobacillus andaensis]